MYPTSSSTVGVQSSSSSSQAMYLPTQIPQQSQQYTQIYNDQPNYDQSSSLNYFPLPFFRNQHKSQKSQQRYEPIVDKFLKMRLEKAPFTSGIQNQKTSECPVKQNRPLTGAEFNEIEIEKILKPIKIVRSHRAMMTAYNPYVGTVRPDREQFELTYTGEEDPMDYEKSDVEMFSDGMRGQLHQSSLEPAPQLGDMCSPVLPRSSLEDMVIFSEDPTFWPSLDAWRAVSMLPPLKNDSDPAPPSSSTTPTAPETLKEQLTSESTDRKRKVSRDSEASTAGKPPAKKTRKNKKKEEKKETPKSGLQNLEMLQQLLDSVAPVELVKRENALAQMHQAARRRM